MFPASLIFPPDRSDAPDQWEQKVSPWLFDELVAARRAPNPPQPSELWGEWKEWERRTFESGPGIVEKDTVRQWLEAFEVSFERRADHPLSPYVRSVSELLSGHGTENWVPIVVAQDDKDAQILRLELMAVENGTGEFWMHPAFEHRKADMNSGEGQFSDAFRTCWDSVREGSNLNLFWRVCMADGSSLPVMQIDGPSASAAAFHAFWHLTQHKLIDPDVYVLADATSPNGAIHSVGHLREKLQAINDSNGGNSFPPTVVVSREVSAADESAINAAHDWAEVVRVADTEGLSAVRSCAAAAAMDYLELFADRLNPVLLPSADRRTRLSDVHIPVHVWKEELRLSQGEESAESDWRPSGYDPSAGDRETGPRLERAKRQIRIPWESEFRRIHRTGPLVLVGGPGLGKTTVLQWTAREMAALAQRELKDRHKSLAEVEWPMLADLDTWAAQEAPPFEALVSAMLTIQAVPERWAPLRMNALGQLLDQRLLSAADKTFIFLDALDQLSEQRSHRLTDWFEQLADFTSRLVLSTREHGLRIHTQNMPFPNLTIVQTATLTPEEANELATKWLGSDRATQLQLHLRSHPSLAVVADSPLLLTLTCIVQLSSLDQSLPESPSELYQSIMRSLAKGEWRKSPKSEGLKHDPDELIASLERVAWRLFVRAPGVNRFDRSSLIDAIEAATGSTLVAANELLATVVDLGFLESAGREGREEQYHFRHTTFLEFLAASHCSNSLNRDGWNAAKVDTWRPDGGWEQTIAGEMLNSLAFEPTWEPLIVHTAGLLREPKPLIESLTDRSKDDIFLHRLHLACRSCGCIPAAKEDGILELVRSIAERMEQLGHKLSRRHPDRWQRWIESVDHLFALPTASKLVTDALVRICMEEHECKMHSDRDIVELLDRRASSTNGESALYGLEVLSKSEFRSPEHSRAIRAFVQSADAQGATDTVRGLIAKLSDQDSKHGTKICIAGALTRSRHPDIADKAIQFLEESAQDWSIEEWLRSSALDSLARLIGTKHETRVVSILAQRLCYPSQDSSTYFAKLILDAASANLTEIGKALIILISSAFPKYHGVTPEAASKLIRTFDPSIMDIGLKAIKNRSNENRLRLDAAKTLVCVREKRFRSAGIEILIQIMEEFAGHGCNDGGDLVGIDAAKALFFAGSDYERDHALDFLRDLLELPVTDGYNHYFAVKGLLDIGLSFAELRDAVINCIECSSVGSARLTFIGELARENGDHEIVELIAPRLKSIVDDGSSDHTECNIAARTLYGTKYWSDIEETSFHLLSSRSEEEWKRRWFAIDVIAFGAKSSAVINLIPELLRAGNLDFRPWHKLFRELDRRGWRLRLTGRRVEILRAGQEQPRPDANFGW